jgi:phosphatidylinositol 4-kinase
MQEPEIFEQPVADRDPEVQVTDEHVGTVYSNGLRETPVEDDESDGYHDFVYPEGSSSFLCPPYTRKRGNVRVS